LIASFFVIGAAIIDIRASYAKFRKGFFVDKIE
jgi:hypothetical protein